jgi:hypothetical protein
MEVNIVASGLMVFNTVLEVLLMWKMALKEKALGQTAN